MYYISVKKFYINFIKLYKTLFYNKHYSYLFNCIYLRLVTVLLKEVTLNDLKNYFIYTCILKQKKYIKSILNIK